MKKLLSLKNVALSFLILIVFWQLIFTFGNFNEALFPSPLKVWEAFVSIADDGSLFVHIGTSMYRFALGYISSIIIAVILGLILGCFRGIFQYVNPILQLLRPISPMAWMPFIVLWFGIGDTPAIVIIFIAAFFPVLLSTVSAVGNIDPIYFKVSKNFGIEKPEIFWKIIFPASFPQIANGIHLALATAWGFLVAGEMVGSQSGLGYLIIDARNNLRPDILLAAIIVIGLIGLLLDTLLKFLERTILKFWGGAE